MAVKNMEKKDTRITTRKSEEGRNPSGISEKAIRKREEVPRLMQLKKEKKNGQPSDPVSNMERMVGRPLSSQEIYYMNW